MATAKSTKLKFKQTDLFTPGDRRKLDKLVCISVPRIEVSVEVEIDKEYPEAKMKKEAIKVLDQYSEIITAEVMRLEDKAVLLSQQQNFSERTRLVTTTEAVARNAIKAAPDAVKSAIQVMVANDAKSAKDLRNARIATGVKVGEIIFDVAMAARDLVQSGGVDLTAWAKLLGNLGNAVEEAALQLKEGSQLRTDLMKALAGCVKLNQDGVKSLANEYGFQYELLAVVTNSEQAVAAVKKIMTAATAANAIKNGEFEEAARKLLKLARDVVSNLSVVEDRMERYKRNTDKASEKLIALYNETESIFKKMKSAATLEQGVQLGVVYMKMKKQVKASEAALEEQKTFLKDMKQVVADGLMLTEADKLHKQMIASFDEMKLSESIKKSMIAVADLVDSF